jgi:hypothetical protein
MSAHAPFSTWLAALLQHLHFPPMPAMPVATFHFDGKPDVYVSGSQGQIDMMSEAGRLAVPYPSDTLLALLTLNRARAADDSVCVTLDRASGTVIVWARQRQAALDAAGGARLLQIVRAKTDAVQQLLGKPGQALPRHGSSALFRMLHKQHTNGA